MAYHNRLHYIFWNYGLHLPKSAKWKKVLREDVSPFSEEFWWRNGFRRWDVEHIYPQKPNDRDTRPGRDRLKNMSQYLNHLGNLTLLPSSVNSGLKNANFHKKLQTVQSISNISFNKLLSQTRYRGNLLESKYWSPNNCRKRIEDILNFADKAWGTETIKQCGVGGWDKRVNFSGEEFEEPEDSED